ncbi:hypothetical protein BH23ACT9_BH23ACT9_39850 [soil metagenome]
MSLMLASTALRHARRRAGLTQRELADITGHAQSTIARIESGAIDPRVGTLDDLLRSCGEELRAVERIGVGVDRTLARRNLTRSPAERVAHMAARADDNLARLATALVAMNARLRGAPPSTSSGRPREPGAIRILRPVPWRWWSGMTCTYGSRRSMISSA